MSGDAEKFAQAARAISAPGGAPVHLWSPPLSGEMDMVIRRDGTWVHEGRVIARAGLVRLFASVLKREEDGFYLVSPVEKWAITVQDAPFIGVDLEVTGQGAAQAVRVITNLGDSAVIGPDHPLRVAEASGGLVPYVTIRAGLEARLDRKSVYRLVDLGTEAAGRFGLWSGGRFFDLGAA